MIRRITWQQSHTRQGIWAIVINVYDWNVSHIVWFRIFDVPVQFYSPGSLCLLLSFVYFIIVKLSDAVYVHFVSYSICVHFCFFLSSFPSFTILFTSKFSLVSTERILFTFSLIKQEEYYRVWTKWEVNETMFGT